MLLLDGLAWLTEYDYLCGAELGWVMLELEARRR
jgi:hypothetical protein